MNKSCPMVTLDGESKCHIHHAESVRIFLRKSDFKRMLCSNFKRMLCVFI